MTTAEKLQMIAENEQRVYEAGKRAGMAEKREVNVVEGKTWENYTFFTPEDGDPYGFVASDSRIAIKEVLCFSEDVRVSVSDGYKYLLNYQSGESVVVENYTSCTDWIEEETVIPAGQHFVVLLRANDSSTILPEAGSNLVIMGTTIIDEISAIVERNKDVKHIVQAAGNYGRSNESSTEWARAYKKCLMLLVGTDFHRDATRLKNMIDYLNDSDEIDAGVCLGDSQLLRCMDNDGSWYTDIINNSQKDFYTLLGNHDIGMENDTEHNGTPTLAFERFIEPTIDKIGIAGLTTPYYSKTFDDYKIVLVMLNTYDAPDTLNEDGTYLIPRYCEMFSQAQIDWLIETLGNIPEGYHLVVAMHSVGFENEVVDCNFSHKNREYILEMGYPYGKCTIVPDIINAWKNGNSLSEQYAPVSGYSELPTLSAICDFTSRGASVFACYVAGHQHTDLILKCKKYQDQNIVTLTTASCASAHFQDSDLPRNVDSKSEDALTVVSVDTDAKQVRLVRVGSNMTCDMSDRTYTVIDYE